jgi:ATP-dependent Clp protease ATP-binding subunit ClpA
VTGPFDRFNDRAKRVLALSQDEAIRFNHSYIGPEHLLLGLVREGEGVAGRVLDSLHVKLSAVRTKVEEQIGRGDSTTSPSEIVLSPVVRKIIDDAIEESRNLGHSHVATEHLLLGLIRESDGVAAKILSELGMKLDDIRQRVMLRLDDPSLSSPLFSTSAGGGPFSRFNERAKRVLALAQAEAMGLKHNYIGTEHLLLGLLSEGDNLAAQVLTSLGVDLAKARTAVEFIIGVGAEPTAPSDITLSPRTKKVIELAIDEARRLGHRGVGPEDILLGLLREGEGIASGVIESMGLSLKKVREQLLAVLGQPDAAAQLRGDPFVLDKGPFDLLDDTAKRVLLHAEQEAREMRHNWVGTEHVLLALLSYGAARTLHQLGVTQELARAAVSKAVPPRVTDVTSVTMTTRVKTLIGKAIVLAAPQATRVRPHHLLLALVDDPAGLGARVLNELGVTAEQVRAAIAKEGG